MLHLHQASWQFQARMNDRGLKKFATEGLTSEFQGP